MSAAIGFFAAAGRNSLYAGRGIFPSGRGGPFSGRPDSMPWSFILPLNDAGAGIVNLVPSYALGSPTPTFARASVKWTKLASGLWAQVASGQPCSAYIGMNTSVGAYGGYFAEGARTQLVTPTASIRDMTDASWVKVTMGAAKTATGIDGVANSATTITASGANATILQTLVAAATSRTNSCWVRRKTGTGTVILKQGTATLDFTALINSTTYTLVQLNDSELNVAYGIQINTNGDALDVDFNQFEAGAFASSPIDNAGTRNADVLTYASTGNSLNTAGSVYYEQSLITSSATNGFPFALDQVGTSGHFQSSNILTRQTDGTTNNNATGTPMTNNVMKIAGSWGGSGQSTVRTGGALVSATFDGTLGTNAQINIGGLNGSSAMFGTMSGCRISLLQLSDAQLQDLIQ